MASSQFPVPLARAALALMTPRALDRVVRIVMAKMLARHPRLFTNLARLTPATVHLIPTDTPHRFGLRMGAADTVFYVLDDPSEKAQATILGSLACLVDMLEGSVDGDTLFFARDIEITGDTEIIVGLRNTLDREEICLMDEIVSLCGPFARPASVALDVAGHFAQKLKERIQAAHAQMHSDGGRTS